jgi:pyridoxamine 5'-phosphate oxidase
LALRACPHCRIIGAMSATDPMALFQEWLAAARAGETDDPTAMALATVDATGRPAVRMVLLKAADERGFVFYTNLESPKSADLRAHPQAALCLHWAKLERQVRIDGRVDAVTADEADRYHATRPRLSQLGAWASRQSQPMSGRFELEQAVAAAALRFPFGAVPRPPHWSGWRVIPERIEFWQQRAFRHHDRQLFVREDGSWRMQWLFP